MAGQTRLHRDLGGFQIADFANHHDIRVLPQNRAQGAREAHFDSGIDLGLADAVEVVFDRVLDGHDVHRLGIKPRQRRIQRGGFARPGGAGDQHDAVGSGDQRIHLRQGCRRHAEARQIEPAGLLVEQAQYNAFAVPGRDRRHPDVDRFARHAQRNAAILRQAFFGDVELRHDLDARDDRRMQGARRLDQVAQRAVDAQAHHRAGFEWLDMDVGGAVAQRLGEQCIDQTDQRRVVLAVEQVFHPRDLLQQPRQIQVLRQVIGQRGGA